MIENIEFDKNKQIIDAKSLDVKPNESVMKYFTKSRFTAEQETYMLLQAYIRYLRKFHKIYYFFNVFGLKKKVKVAFTKHYCNLYSFDDYKGLMDVVNKYSNDQLKALITNEKNKLASLLKIKCKLLK